MLNFRGLDKLAENWLDRAMSLINRGGQVHHISGPKGFEDFYEQVKNADDPVQILVVEDASCCVEHEISIGETSYNTFTEAFLDYFKSNKQEVMEAIADLTQKSYTYGSVGDLLNARRRSKLANTIIPGFQAVTKAAMDAYASLDFCKPYAIVFLDGEAAENMRAFQSANTCNLIICHPAYYENSLPEFFSSEEPLFTSRLSNRTYTLKNVGAITSSIMNHEQEEIRKGFATSIQNSIDGYNRRIESFSNKFAYGLPENYEGLGCSNGNLKVYFDSPDKIKKYIKDAPQNVKLRLSSNKLAKQGILAVDSPPGHPWSTFWTYRSKTPDAIDVKATAIQRAYSDVTILMAAESSVYKETDPCTFDVVRDITLSEVCSTSVHASGFWGHLELEDFVRYFIYKAHVVALENLLDAYENKADIELLAPFILELQNTSLESQLEELFAVYEKALGGKVDNSFIQKTAFQPYYNHLTDSQKIRLREFINAGSVNEDVLNNQPFTVWLLLTTNSSLNRLKTKKAKIFNSMRFEKPLPKWLLNYLLEEPEKVTAAELNYKKKFFQMLKRTWGSNRTLAWLVASDDKIFSGIDKKALTNFLHHCNAVEAFEEAPHVSWYGYYHTYPPKFICDDRETSFGSQNVFNDLYQAHLGSLSDEDTAQEDYSHKQFLIEFKEFVENFFQDSYTLAAHKPNTKENFNDYSGTAPQYGFNDLFNSSGFLYGVLAGVSPDSSWLAFKGFIKQMNQWVRDGKTWHTAEESRRQREAERQGHNFYSREYGIIRDTEAFVRELISQSGCWFEWHNQRWNADAQNERQVYYCSSEAPGALVDTPDTGYSPSAYKGVAALCPFFIRDCRSIPRHSVEDIQSQKDNVYKPVPGLQGYEYKGIKVTQILNEFSLREEGKNMNHCVGGFSNACASGASVIFHLQPAPGAMKEDGTPYPNTATTTLEWNPAGVKVGVAGHVNTSTLPKGTVAKYTLGQHHAAHNQRPYELNKEVANQMLKQWNKTMSSEKFQLFMKIMSLFDMLAIEEGFVSFADQLSPVTSKDAKKKADNVMRRYYAQIQAALGNNLVVEEDEPASDSADESEQQNDNIVIELI